MGTTEFVDGWGRKFSPGQKLKHVRKLARKSDTMPVYKKRVPYRKCMRCGKLGARVWTFAHDAWCSRACMPREILKRLELAA